MQDSNGDDIDLSTYTAEAQFRKYYESTVFTPFICNTSSAGVTLSLAGEVTANVVAGRYVYDVVIISEANVVSRVAEGILTIRPMVTRD